MTAVRAIAVVPAHGCPSQRLEVATPGTFAPPAKTRDEHPRVLEFTAMWLSGDLDVGRDHFIDFFTAFILASIHMPASLDQSAGSSTAAG